jgi:thymidylate synthase
MSGHPHFNLKTKEDFIEKIKTDERFAKEYGELGPIYGKQWRQWQGWMTTSKGEMGSLWYDQIQRLIYQLKTEPDSRRLMVSAWNVAELDQMVLPPCHYGFQVYTRDLTYRERYDIWFNNNYQTGFEFNYDEIVNFEDKYWVPTPKKAISLMWNQRSVDTFLGLPFNIASYALLLMLLGKEVNMIPDELIGNLGDVHLYGNHIEQASEQIKREPYKLPKVELDFDFQYWDGYVVDWAKIDISKIKLINYISHPTIKAPLSN